MKSNYNKLGEYIREVNKRNNNLQVSLLLGVSVSKEFMPSIANTVGTDFSKYKIVQKNQFTYIPDTSRRGDKIGIALLKDYKEALVSQAYTVFEIIDTEKLLPEYLMMWFRRSEFDRYARFKSEGSVREIFSWNELCNVELPVPEIEQQRKIVEQYNQINRSIQIKEAINNNLEQQADAIFHSYFIDKKDYVATKNTLGNICKCELGGTPSRDVKEYWGGDIAWINSGKINDFRVINQSEFITELGLKKSATKLMPPKTVVIAITGATLGQVSILEISAAANQSVIGILENNEIPFEYIYPYIKYKLQLLLTYQTGGAQQHINKQ